MEARFLIVSYYFATNLHFNIYLQIENIYNGLSHFHKRLNLQ